MKKRYLATVIGTGAIAAAIAAAPGASAALPVLDTMSEGVTITQRDGHTAINATPDLVSPPRSYGPFSSPLPLLGN
jgi:hypothetical protein